MIIEYDEKKEGAGATRNRGAKKAKGDYYFYCDNDLELMPDCLENLYRTLRENKDCKWAFGKFYIDNVLFNQNKNLNIPKNTATVAFIEWFHCISTMSLIDASVKPVWDNLKRYDDWDLWVSLYKQGHKPAFCDEVLFKTYNRPNGITQINDDSIRENKEILYKKHNIDPKAKLADIIIPHHNRHDHLKNCLDKLDNKLFNIIIVSGGSFSENCNEGAKIARTDNLIFLNDDTLPDGEILKKMIDCDGDLTGVAQTIPKHKIIFYGIGYKLKSSGYLEAGLTRKPEENHIPSGYCFKVKRKAWLELGGLDERFKNGGEDQDLGFRAIEKGYKIDYVLEPMTHYESQSEGRFTHGRDNEALLNKLWSKEKLIKLLKL